MPQDYGKILSKFGNKDLSQLNRPQRIFEKVTGYLVKQQEDEAIRDALQRVRRARASVSGLPFMQPYDATGELEAFETLSTQGGERGRGLISPIAATRPRQDITMTDAELAGYAGVEQSKGIQDGPATRGYNLRQQSKTQPKKSIDRVVSKDGFYYDVIEDPQTGEVEYRKTNVEARPQSSSQPKDEKDVKVGEGNVKGKKVATYRRPDGSTYQVPLGEATGAGGGSGTGAFPRTIPMVKQELDARGQHKTVTKTYKSKGELSARMKSIDDLVKKSGVEYDRGGYGFLTPNVPVYDAWQEFIQGNVTIEDLPEDFRAYASEYSQLQSNLEDAEGLTAGTEQAGETTEAAQVGGKTKYEIGKIYEGETGKYKYLGGDESDPANWEKVR